MINENRPSLKPSRDHLLHGIDCLGSRRSFRRQLQWPTCRRAKTNLARFHQNLARPAGIR